MHLETWKASSADIFLSLALRTAIFSTSSFSSQLSQCHVATMRIRSDLIASPSHSAQPSSTVFFGNARLAVLCSNPTSVAARPTPVHLGIHKFSVQSLAISSASLRNHLSSHFRCRCCRRSCKSTRFWAAQVQLDLAAVPTSMLWWLDERLVVDRALPILISRSRQFLKLHPIREEFRQCFHPL